MKRLSYFLIFFLASISQYALGGVADVDIVWKASAIDRDQKTPIEGVTFLFKFTDNSNGNISEKTCVSNSQGECEVVARANRGLFTGADLGAVVRFEKTGYSRKASTKWNGNALTVWMTTEEWLKGEADQSQAEADEKAKQLQTDADEKSKRLQAEADERSKRVQAEAGEQLELQRKLTDAEKESTIPCVNRKQCDKVFSLAEFYIGKTSDMKIQLVTTNTIETFNPTEDFKIGLSANRIPGKGDSSLIAIRTTCKNSGGFSGSNICLRKQLQATLGFTSFVSSMLKD